MCRASVVVCYNDRSEFSELRNDIYGQSERFELIGIDNTLSNFKSCSAAYNHALKQVKTEYVFFSHQDIRLPSKNMLSDFADEISKAGKGDILGVAGVESNSRNALYALSNIRHGLDGSYPCRRRVKSRCEVQTVDECFFGGYTQWFLENPFDEDLCDGWHLYAVERCLYTATHGGKVYVCGIPLIHLSEGGKDQAYNKEFYRISRAYANSTDRICSMCNCDSTRPIVRELAFIRRLVGVIYREGVGRFVNIQL